MPSFVRLAGVLLPLTMFGVGIVGTTPAFAQSTPCTGTLCDLYYKSTGGTPAPATPAAVATQAANGQPLPPGATPMTVPSMPGTGGIMNFFRGGSSNDGASQQTASAGGAAPSSSGGIGSMFKGGGLLGGSNSEPCSGTICDLYHGTTGSGSSASAPAAASASAGTAVSSSGLSTASAYVPPRQVAAQVQVDPAILRQAAERRKVSEAAREARAKCHTPNDPWHCMR